MSNHLFIFVNMGLVFGFLLSFVISPDVALLVLPCCCAGIQIYCAMFLGFPGLFTNGEKPKEDRYRYGSIFIGLLLTVLYYPICYLLRI